jgi:serine/threonine protein phosphatase PrpC
MPVTFINLNGIKGFNIFGVLDGHGVNGHHVSKFLSEYLVKQIINSKEISGITNLDAIYQRMKRANYELLITVFLNADKMLGKQKFDVSFSGTTCVLVIQIGRNLICANVGDSRAILIYDKYGDKNLKNPAIFELSHDFKPDLPDEKKRILLLGGMVEQMMDINGFRGGPQRVWAKNKNFPGLAMSRSLGDYKGKQCGIIPLPEFIEYKLNEESKYMVICSDGVWEFLSNKNVMEIGNRYYLKNDIHGFTQRLIQISEKMWEKTDVIVDDITAVIVYF